MEIPIKDNQGSRKGASTSGELMAWTVVRNLQFLPVKQIQLFWNIVSINMRAYQTTIYCYKYSLKAIWHASVID